MDSKQSCLNLLKNSEFLKVCNTWEDRLTADGVMSDIIDGKVRMAGRNANANTLGFLLNIDWFQLFKDVSLPVGVYFELALEYTIQG